MKKEKAEPDNVELGRGAAKKNKTK